MNLNTQTFPHLKDQLDWQYTDCPTSMRVYVLDITNDVCFATRSKVTGLFYSDAGFMIDVKCWSYK